MYVESRALPSNSTHFLTAKPGKPDTKIRKPGILYLNPKVVLCLFLVLVGEILKMFVSYESPTN